ncbi:MAG: energy-dependent translational throttle protein EttA [Caldilineaceae bacterium]|nr:energy-dependent translational throttle protein EttA [Caldilineaceae bacterium]MDE0182895.1 energy-dependent translational throttle protein EttA [Caldilineaceae bacterium]
MSDKVIYSMVGVGKSYPQGQRVLREISLGFFLGAKIGVLGLNGAGKSTMLRIMAGEEDEHDGDTILTEGYTRGFLPQEPVLDPSKTVRQIIEEGAQEAVDALAEFDEINARFGEDLSPEEMDTLIEQQGLVQEKLDALGAWDLDSRLELAMDALRCPTGETRISTLSGGELRRVALTRLLLREPDILLLDEPTNHLDAQSVAWLERHLQAYAGTVIAVTHDRYFLDNVAGWILELDRGHGIPWRGNYSGWLAQKQQRLAQEERQESARQKTLQRELEWLQMSPKAQQTKRKARVNAYNELLSQEFEEAREEREIYIPPGPRLGDMVIRTQELRKGYGENLLFEDLTIDIPPGAIVGIVGPNGAGKTTLFRLIAGEEEPDGGSVQLGDSVSIAYVDQSREDLDPRNSVWEEISGGNEQLRLGERLVNSRAYVARFTFSGADQQKKVGTLSGGERNRVHLAKLVKSGANVILLDEPSNDLDVNTLRALEDALETFAGTALVISHDRWFLDRIATHIIAFEGDSRVTWFAGNFSEYEEDRVRRLGAEAERPHRITYRKLSRA